MGARLDGCVDLLDHQRDVARQDFPKQEMTESEFTARSAQAQKETQKYVLVFLASTVVCMTVGIALLKIADERQKLGDHWQESALRTGFLVFFIGGAAVSYGLAAWTPYRVARKVMLRCPKCRRLLVGAAPKLTLLTGKCAWCKAPLFDTFSQSSPPEDVSTTERRFRLRRNASREDAPLLCALFGALAAAFSLASFMNHDSEMGDHNRMESFSGTVVSVVHTTDRIKSRSNGLLQFEIVNGDLRRFFVQFDSLSQKLPALSELRVGDSIVALGRKDSSRPDRIWFYEIHVGQTTLISPAQTVSALHQPAKMMGYIGGCASLALLLSGLALRMHSGAWMFRTGASGLCSSATDRKPILEPHKETLSRKAPETKD